MAHLIDTVTATGKDAMIYAENGATPWHRLGTPISEDQSMDLDLAMRMGGIDFTVEKASHHIFVPCDAADPRSFYHPTEGLVRSVKSDDGFSIVRTDRYSVIGTVGEIYTPLQNGDAWAPIRPVLDEGLATIETAGSLRGGRQCWMMLKFDTDAIMEKARSMVSTDATATPVTAGEVAALEDTLRGEAGEGILPYGLLTTDHTGKQKARLKETGVRVVCSNTLEFSLGSSEGGISVAVPHVRGVTENWKEATEALFGNLVMRFIGLANYRAILKSATLDNRSFVDLVLEATIPVRQLEERIMRRDGTKLTETSLAKSGEKRNRIRHLWTDGRGQVGDHSAWEAYQGVIEFIDHDKEALPKSSNRVQSLMDGTLKKAKSNVFRNLMAYSLGTDESRDLVAEMLGRHETAPVVQELLRAARN